MGGQGTSYTEHFSAGEDPDSSIDADIVFDAGGGFQIRLGDRVIMGATLGIAAELGGASRHVQGGFHVGYAWQPPE